MVKYQDTLERSRLSWIRTLRFLDVHPHHNRRVVADICEARAMMALFFPSKFLHSEYGVLHKYSKLLHQDERAKTLPNRRPHASNKFKTKSFWEEWDTYWKTHRVSDYNIERDAAVRPIIAKLYKVGVIRNTFLSRTPGNAMAAKEGERDRDFYIDFRSTINGIVFPPEVERPPSKEYLLLTARKFVKNNPSARFALLRLWEAPHFYPLMMGYERREITSFSDALGRAFEWNFVPKDMP